MTEDSTEPTAPAATWEGVVALTDEVFAVHVDVLDVANTLAIALRRRDLRDDDPLVLPLRIALDFFLEEKSDPARVALEPSPLRPQRAGDPVVTPSAATTGAWERFAAEVTHPAARARFLDLLTRAGGRGNPERVARAMEAYLDFAESPPYRLKPDGQEPLEGLVDWTGRERDLAVGRALSIAHIVKSRPDAQQLTDRARDLALRRAESNLSLDTPPTTTVMLLALLVRDARRLDVDQRNRLEASLVRGWRSFGHLDHVVDELAALLVKVAPDRRVEANRARVQARLDLATSRGGGSLVAMHFLADAATLATKLSVEDLRVEATRQLQRLEHPPDTYQKISAETAIPREYVDAEVERMVRGRDWREALTSWLASGSPTGNADANRRSTDALLTKSLLHALGMPIGVSGADGLPSWTATTPEERFEYQLAKSEQLTMGFKAMLLADALDVIKIRYDVPDIDDLTTFLSADGGGSGLAAALARSFHRYWNQDYEGCLYTAILRAETGARLLTLALDEPAYQVARAGTPGKYLGLPQLVEILRDHGLDEDWERFLHTFLYGLSGRAERHHVAHGFRLDSASRESAVLALRAASLFALLLWDPGSATPRSPAFELTPGVPSVSAAVAGVVRAATVLRVPVRALVRHEARTASAVLRRVLLSVRNRDT